MKRMSILLVLLLACSTLKICNLYGKEESNFYNTINIIENNFTLEESMYKFIDTSYYFSYEYDEQNNVASYYLYKDLKFFNFIFYKISFNGKISYLNLQ